MDSSIPLYKQLTFKFFGLFFVIVILLLLLISLLLNRDLQLSKTARDILPEFEKLNNYNLQVTNLNKLLAQSLTKESSEDLFKTHEKLNITLTNLNKLDNTHKKEIASSLQKLSPLKDELTKLVLNAERNEQLRQQSIIQVKLVIDNLNIMLNEQKLALDKIETQIINNEVTSALATQKAQQYITLMDRFKFYSTSQEVLVLALNKLNDLSLNSKLVNLELLNEQLVDLITRWQAHFSLNNEQSEFEQETYYLVQQLNALLFVEQNTMAKWHSTLRISEEYRVNFTSLPVYISPIVVKQLPLLSQEISQELAFLPVPINKVLSRHFNLDNQAAKWLFYALIALLSASAFFFIYIVRNAVRNFSFQHLSEIEQYLNSSHDETKVFHAKETCDVVELISDIEKPEHGEHEYQLLKSDIKSREAFLLENKKLCYWQVKTSISELLQNSNLLSTLNLNSRSFTSWRQVLGKSAFKNVINAAKLSKENGKIQELEVHTNTGLVFTLSIKFESDFWHGVVQDTGHIFELRSELDDLQSSVESSQKRNAQTIALIANEFSRMLIKTMLQSQRASIGNGASSVPVYRQLRRILEKCRQLQISKALIYSDNERQLSEVNIRNELAALFYNLSSEANLQRNHTILNICDEVTKNCQLNVRLFHRCIKAIFRLAIGEQFNSSLMFDVSLVDKNSGQQILRMTLDHHLAKPISQLPVQINELLNIINGEKIDDSLMSEYIGSLFSSIHGSNCNGQLTEHGYQLFFDFPITPINNNQHFKPVNKISMLRDKHILFLTEQNSFAKHIQSELKFHEANVEILSDAKYFAKQLSIKHLKANPVALVVVGTDFVKSDLIGIKQYLQSLPNSLRPKLMVLQGAYNQPLQRFGLYAQSMQMQSEQSITFDIVELLDSDEKENLIIPPEIFHNYRFEISQIELLLAVETPEQHQLLVRILHWFGLQVHVVCHHKAMLKHWQTGRYLILLTEFEDCPYLELSVGNNIPRTIFKLAQQTFTNQVLEKPTNWHQASLPNITDIHAMVSAFSPWLNEESTQLIQSKSADKNDELRIDKVEQDNHEDRKFEIEIDDNVFNLKAFSLNQGSAELAGFMIEDYLNDLKVEMDKFELAIKNSASEDAKLALVEIRKYAQILSASELLEQVNRISSFMRTLNSPKLSTELMDLKLKHEQLVLVAEAV